MGIVGDARSAHDLGDRIFVRPLCTIYASGSPALYSSHFEGTGGTLY